jgi:hypothetical protein
MQNEGPAWFRVNSRFLKGVEYLCDSGFSRASAPPALPDGTPSTRAHRGAGPATAASVVIAGVLSQINRLLACTHAQAAAELKGLKLPAQDDLGEVALSLNLGNDSKSASEGQDAAVESTFIDTFAEEEDEDDFVYESLDASQKGLVRSLLPAESPDSPPLTAVPVGKDAQAQFRGWESGGECLRKLLTMAKVVTYARVAKEWHTLQVNDLLLRIVQRLLELPPALWRPRDAVLEEAGVEQEPSAVVEGRGGSSHVAAALMVHFCFLIRDRICSEPKDVSEV